MKKWATGFCISGKEVWPIVHLYEGPWWAIQLRDFSAWFGRRLPQNIGIKGLPLCTWWALYADLRLEETCKRFIRETKIDAKGNDHLLPNYVLKLAERRREQYVDEN